MAYNKFTHKNEILLDLTQDGLTDDTTLVREGVAYHGRDGQQYIGTGAVGVGYTTEENDKGTTMVFVKGGGGPQPKLFEPIVTYPKLNQIAWERDTRNGDFGDYVVATLDGVEVQSPYDFTEEDNGKNIVITAKCDGFEDTIVSIIIEYVVKSSSKLFTRNTIYTTSTPYIPDMTIYYRDSSSNRQSHNMGYYESNVFVFDFEDILKGSTVVKDLSTSAWITFRTDYQPSTLVATINGITKSYSGNTNTIWLNMSDFNIDVGMPYDDFEILITTT